MYIPLQLYELGPAMVASTVTLKVDRSNRLTLVRRDEGSHWRDVREPQSLWTNSDDRQFEAALEKYVAGLRHNGHAILFQGSNIQRLGYYDQNRLKRMRKRLLADLDLARRDLLEGDFGAPDERSKVAAQRLEAFAQDIERASDMLIGRLVAASHNARFWKTWNIHRALVAHGRLKYGTDVLNAVASTCKPVD
jgi:hypothetical protein